MESTKASRFVLWVTAVGRRLGGKEGRDTGSRYRYRYHSRSLSLSRSLASSLARKLRFQIIDVLFVQRERERETEGVW